MDVLHGVVMISEGVFHFLADEEIKNCGIEFTYDEHGHPELGNVSKAHIINVLVQRKLKELGISIKSRPVEGIPGRRSMPQFNLSDEDLNALAEFLKYTSEINTAGWPPNIQG